MMDSGNDSGWGHFQCLPTDFLVKVVNGEIDLNAWAALELASRGVKKTGKSVGCKAAKKLYRIVEEKTAYKIVNDNDKEKTMSYNDMLYYTESYRLQADDNIIGLGKIAEEFGMNLTDELNQIQALIDNIGLKISNTIRAAMNTSKSNNK